MDFSDVEFEIELLKTDEINLDYILELIFEKMKEHKNKEEIKEEITRLIKSNIGTRAKESLMIDFIDQSDIGILSNQESIIDQFYKYAKEEKETEIIDLIKSEDLKGNSESFIKKSIRNGYVSSQGTELDEIIPPTSRRKGAREKKKEQILEKMQNLVSKFLGI